MKKSSLKKLLAGISALCFATAAVPFVGSAAEAGKPTLVGDANFDGQVDLSDAVIIMQALANPDKYGLGGSDEHAITQQGWINADCNGAVGILRKANVIQDSALSRLLDRGDVVSPCVLNVRGFVRRLGASTNV